MDTQARDDMNAAFGVNPELLARAQAQVDAEFDEAAELERIKAQLLKERQDKLRAQAADALTADDDKTPDGLGFPRKYVRLMVYESRDRTEQPHVKVGVNGYMWKIQRGKPVITHSVVADALNDAQTEVPTQTEGGLETRPAHRFPFQVIGEATEQEYLAFRDKARAEGVLVGNA